MAVKKEVAKLLVKNRPLGHYVLSVYSLLFRGYCDCNNTEDIITLIAPSRSIGRTTDLANILARVCAPGKLWLGETKISNRLQGTKSNQVYPKVSNLIVKLTCFEESRPEIQKAFKNFNAEREKEAKKGPVDMPEYTFIEALMTYQKELFNARGDIKRLSQQEIKSLKEKFDSSLKESQEEFLDKVKDAIRELKSSKTSTPTPTMSKEFNICELEFILSTLLKEGCELHFTCPDGMEIKVKWSNEEKRIAAKGTPKIILPNEIKGEKIQLGEVLLRGKNIAYIPPSHPCSVQGTQQKCQDIDSSVEVSLMRMGLLPFPELEGLAKDMCRFDDVLIGLDTTCFYHGVTTAALLDSLVGVACYPYLDTPNWITLIASVISTGEIEHKATNCGDKDYFENKDTQEMHNRRKAYRALQEFMEISTCADLEGVSMLLTGEISPDINFSKGSTVRDELIRKQIKNFLGNLGFHKGTYFLTEDRACAMFARAGGLNAVRLTRGKYTSSVELTCLHPSSNGEERDIHNVSELVYELGIEFPLKITCKGKDCSLDDLSFIVKTDWWGKKLEEWENRKLMVEVVSKNRAMTQLFSDRLTKNADAVNLGQLLWGWKRVNDRHHEVPGFPGWAT